MGLFTSLNTGLSSLMAQMAALETTGHNIANANTPGYSRQRVDLQASAPRDMVFAQVGTGVNIAKVSRIVDSMLSLRIGSSNSSLESLSAKLSSMQQTEGIFNALSENDLSGSMAEFFNNLSELVNNPDDGSIRQLVMQSANVLSDSFNSLNDQLRELRSQLSGEVDDAVNNINSLTSQIAELNDEILRAERGGNSPDTANDLRDRRDLLVSELSGYIKIKPIETSNGVVNILSGSNYLVFSKNAYELDIKTEVNNDVLISTPYFKASGVELEVNGGKLKGLIEGQSEVAEFSDQLDLLAHNLIFEFNKIQSTGVGLERYTSIESNYGVNSQSVSTAPLAVSGSVDTAPTTKTLTDSGLIGYADDLFKDLNVLFTSGKNEGKSVQIRAFDGSTGTLLLEDDFPYSISSNDTFQITSLNFELEHGSFDINVTNELTGTVDNYNILVDLDKSGTDSTLQDIVDQINNKLGGTTISASLSTDNKLTLTSSDMNTTFSFANDSSNFLAAMGLGTFFDGGSAKDINVSDKIQNNVNLISAGLSNNPTDNSNAIRMADLRTNPLMNSGSSTLEEYYQGIVSSVGIKVAEYNGRVENQQALNDQLSNERERTSGVNVDEEAMNMINYQRAYQAAARYINTINTLLDTLINSI